jgi:integrase
MKMRVKNGKWYSAFRHKGKWIGVSLNAYKHEQFKALQNLCDLHHDLKNGLQPNGMRKKIKFLNPIIPFNEFIQQLRDKHIDPFFGEYIPNDITQEIIEKYIEHKWGLNAEGNLQAMESSFKKHMAILRQLIQSVDENYKFNKKLIAGLKYDSLTTDLLPPLTRDQINKAWDQAQKVRGGKIFKKAFWIMVWTGMEPMDIVDLKPKHFVKIQGHDWLIKDRHKNHLKKHKTKTKIPVVPELKKIMSDVPVPLDKNAPYFPNVKNGSISQMISKYFGRAGLKGYGAKYLRRYLGERMLDIGTSRDWIGQALGHAFDSEVTRRYMRVRDDKMIEVFEKISNQG